MPSVAPEPIDGMPQCVPTHEAPHEVCQGTDVDRIKCCGAVYSQFQTRFAPVCSLK